MKKFIFLTSCFTILLLALVNFSCSHPDSSDAVSSSTTTLPAPAAPSGLGAVVVSSSGINLTWTDNSDNESGFKIERALNSGFSTPHVITVAVNVTSYSDTGLSPDTTYYYRVYAFNPAGNSGYSNSSSATTDSPPLTAPAAPSGLGAAAVSSSGIDLAWTDNSDNESGFKIERALNSGFSTPHVITVAANVTSYSDSGLSPDTTYYYRVYAFNSAGDSGYSNSSSATTEESAGTIEIKLEFKKGSAGGAAAIYVAWLEKPSDNFLQNLTICRKLRGIGGTLTNTALPFWKINRYPHSDAAEVDAVTGVTKTTDFTITRVLKDPNQKKFTCYFELDHSFDRNDWFHENTPGKDDDQPAIIYAVDIDLDNPQNVYTLNFLGR